MIFDLCKTPWVNVTSNFLAAYRGSIMSKFGNADLSVVKIQPVRTNAVRCVRQFTTATTYGMQGAAHLHTLSKSRLLPSLYTTTNKDGPEDDPTRPLCAPGVGLATPALPI